MDIFEFFGLLGPIWLGIVIGLVVGKIAASLIDAAEYVAGAWQARQAVDRQRHDPGRPELWNRPVQRLHPRRMGTGKRASRAGV